ncbi:MAG: hypothetical protein ACPGSN_09145, partial [Psychrobium sp.]
MFKGTVMLIATLVSNAYASTPMQEANLLTNKPSEISSFDHETAHLIAMLNERKSKLDETILEAKNTYFSLSEDNTTFDMDSYEELVNLDLALRGISAHLKKVWSDHSDDIRS